MSEPETNQKTEQDARELLPVVLFVFGIVLVTLIAPLYKGFLHLDEVARGLGEALIIASVASIAIERTRLKSFSEELSKQVQRKLNQIEQTTRDLVYQGPLPRLYYEKVSEILLQNHFWRPQWALRVYLSEAAQKPGFLTFSYKQEYKIENFYGFEKSYPLDHFEYLYWEHELPNTTRFDYVRARLEGSETLLINESNLDRAVVACPGYDMIRFSKDVTIPAKRVLVVEEGLTRVMPDHGLDYFVIGEPTDGVECRVEYPADLVVNMEWPELQLNQKAPSLVPTEEPAPPRKRCTVWRFLRPMPPYSYFVIRWLKKKGQA